MQPRIDTTTMLLVLLGLAVVVAALALWRRWLARQREPACGACGYAVAGLTQLLCPECGRDLREVGIRAPRVRGPLSPWVFIFLLTALLPPPAVLTTIFLYERLGRQQSHRESTVWHPKSGRFDTMDVDFTVSRWALPEGNGHGSVTLKIQHSTREWLDGTGWSLEVNLPSQVYFIRSPDGTLADRGMRLNRRAVLTWMQRAGCSVDDDAAPAEADDVCREVTRLAHWAEGDLWPSFGTAQDSFVHAQGNFGGLAPRTNAVLLPMWPAAVFWGVVWCLGLWAIVWQTRRNGGAMGAPSAP